MSKNKHQILKSFGALLLAFAMLWTINLCAPRQAMAAGGTVTVKLGQVKGLSEETEFEFEMYKVGNYNNGSLELYDAVKESNAKMDNDPDDSEGWLESALTVSDYIDNNGISLINVGGTHTLRPGESFDQPVEKDGLYLVKSSAVRDGENAAVTWSPQPVFVAVLDGDTSITINNKVVIKLVKTTDSINHRVTKIWDIPSGSEKSVKPAEINVNICFSGEIIDTVKLNADNNWSYAWSSVESGDTYVYIGKDQDGNKKTIEFEPNMKNPKWTCTEIFDADEFKEAYGRAPSKEEASELEKLSKGFKAVQMSDKTSVSTTDDEEVTLHRIKNVYKVIVPPPPSVKTGDESNIKMWVSVLITAAALLVLLVIYRRKRERRG